MIELLKKTFLENNYIIENRVDNVYFSYKEN